MLTQVRSALQTASARPVRTHCSSLRRGSLEATSSAVLPACRSEGRPEGKSSCASMPPLRLLHATQARQEALMACAHVAFGLLVGATLQQQLGNI